MWLWDLTLSLCHQQLCLRLQQAPLLQLEPQWGPHLLLRPLLSSAGLLLAPAGHAYCLSACEEHDSLQLSVYRHMMHLSAVGYSLLNANQQYACAVTRSYMSDAVQSVSNDADSATSYTAVACHNLKRSVPFEQKVRL